MSSLEIIGLCVIVWLWGTRVAIRWAIELDNMEIAPATAIMCFCFSWLVVLIFLPERLAKAQHLALSPRLYQIMVGESKWHKRERLAKEHAQRVKDVGMPIS